MFSCIRFNAMWSAKSDTHEPARVNAVDPGYTDTDLNGHTGTQTVAEGAEIIVAMAQAGPQGPSGTFTSKDGPVAW